MLCQCFQKNIAFQNQQDITTENIVFSMTTRKEPYENEYAKTLYEIPGKTPFPHYPHGSCPWALRFHLFTLHMVTQFGEAIDHAG